ncbi:MAG: type IX secretion system protein PorQ [Bacteroides sp.]|nr:type IX secretion system protein PorQ [Bacteroides sp.]
MIPRPGNIIRGLTLLLGVLTFGSVGAFAQSGGNTFYSFLDIPSSTLAYGLGGMNISNIDDDINAADRNPGLLGSEVDMQLGINYMRYVGESNFAGIKFGHSAGDHGAWAAGVQYMGYGSIKGADVNGVLTGDFSPKDMILSGTYAHDITDRWRGGATLKYVYSTYDAYSAMALGTDLGVNYYDPDRDLSFSAMIANLGGQIKRFDRRYERMPVDIRLGLSKGLSSIPLVLSVTAHDLTRWHLPYYDAGDGSEDSTPQLKDKFMSNLFRHLIFGADFSPSDNFHIGLGYNYRTRTDMSTYKRSFLSGFSACMGLNVRNFALGIAFAQPHTGATTLMLNISTRLYEF